MLTIHAPLTQVLAVIAQKAIAVFSDPGARPLHDIGASQLLAPCRADPHRMAVCETCERSLLDRSPVPVFGEGGIVHHRTAAHINTMVCIGETRRNEVSTQRWLLMARQQPVLCANPDKYPLTYSRAGVIATLLEAERSAKQCDSSRGEHLAVNDVHGGVVR
jgi:hypothetical protein